jgi:hypothetical protein
MTATVAITRSVCVIVLLQLFELIVLRRAVSCKAFMISMPGVICARDMKWEEWRSFVIVSGIAAMDGITSHDIGVGVTILLKAGIFGVHSDRTDVAVVKSTKGIVKLAIGNDNSIVTAILFVLVNMDEVRIAGILSGKSVLAWKSIWKASREEEASRSASIVEGNGQRQQCFISCTST